MPADDLPPDVLAELPEAFRTELRALNVTALTLQPLSPAARARVILFVALACSPRALSDHQLWLLVQQARGGTT